MSTPPPFQPPPEPPKKKPVTLIGIIVGIAIFMGVIGVIVIAVVIAAINNVQELKAQKDSTAQEQAEVQIMEKVKADIQKYEEANAKLQHPAAQWIKKTYDDVTIEMPFPLNPATAEAKAAVQAVQDMIVNSSGFSSEEDTKPYILIIKFEYKQDVIIDIDKAIKGTLDAAGGDLVDTEILQTPTPVNVSGLQARTGSISGKFQGEPIIMQTLIIQKGQTMWVIQAILTDPGFMADSQKILESVQVGSN